MSDLSLFASVPRGLESMLAGELRALGAAHVRQVRAGVAFRGSSRPPTAPVSGRGSPAGSCCR